MNRLFRLKNLIAPSAQRRAGALLLVMAAALTGCRSESEDSALKAVNGAATPNLDAEIARASSLRQPILVLVDESGQSRADDQARALVATLAAQGKLETVVPVLVDLGFSRNRAAAARFHVTNTPVLLCLSPRGLIVTRDETSLTKELVLKRIEEVARLSPALDANLVRLEEQVARSGSGVAAQLELAEFLLARQNAREAIPHLEAVAHDETADPTPRVRAWVELARAHLWIAEPEKGRHEANDLIARLGPLTAEARAGGNLVLGLQDANAKRMALARRELEAAIGAVPQSDYARQARDALAKFPGEAK